MNRTALCIEMLMLLKARGKMNTQELAQALETNPRNVREFKKELITAGYNIQEFKGRYGGYQLDENCLFPSTSLTDDEAAALQEARELVKTHPEFASLKDFEKAIDKVFASNKDFAIQNRIYLDSNEMVLSGHEKEMMDASLDAIKQNRCVKLEYQGANQDLPSVVIVEPYEVIHYHHAYYLIGFSRKRNDYRMYRFSDQRMYSLSVLSDSFLRDSFYSLSTLIGKHSLFKGGFKKIEVRVAFSKVRMFQEIYWGLDFMCSEQTDTYSVFTFYTDDLYTVYRQLFSYGDAAILLAPQECVDEFSNQVQSILNNYKR